MQVTFWLFLSQRGKQEGSGDVIAMQVAAGMQLAW
jgi:hypothetical protein